MDTTKQTELLKKALEKFNKTTGMKINLIGEEYAVTPNLKADAIVRFTEHGIDKEFVVEVKTKLTTATLGGAVMQLKRFPQKGLIITDYVNPNMAERLKEMDIPFIDIAGNAYINEPQVFVYIKGERPVEIYHKETQIRIFQPTGLKVLFAFLCRPELINAPYRDIAKAAKVALGAVGWILTDLKKTGYLIDMGKRGRRLVEKKKLIDRWVMAYPEKLRPKLIVGRYKADNLNWWRDTIIKNFQAYWGGEIAAAKLTQHLKPEFATIYAIEKTAHLLLENKLKTDIHGNVEILNVFWNFKYDWQYLDLVPPLLIYADLLATTDARNIETAKIIYDQEIIRLIRED